MSEFVVVATTDELKSGDSPIVVEIDRKWVAVFNLDGEYYAIEDVCTHDDGPLAEGRLTGCIIECPRHGATFDVKTGKVLSAPAYADIPTYFVRVVEGEIQVGAVMTEPDARVLDTLGEGVVLTPSTPGPSFGDVVALREGNRVINGHGAMNLSDLSLLEIDNEASRFYSPTASEAFRKELLAKYCIDYVFCPDTHPVDEAVFSAFSDIACLEEVAREDKAVLFEVIVSERENQHEH